MFGRWGRFVYRHRWATLVGSGVVLAASVVFLVMGGTLTNGGPLSSRLESFQVNRLINSELNKSGNTAPTTSTFDLIFKSKTLSVSDAQYKTAVTDALAPIQSNSHVTLY